MKEGTTPTTSHRPTLTPFAAISGSALPRRRTETLSSPSIQDVLTRLPRDVNVSTTTSPLMIAGQDGTEGFQDIYRPHISSQPVALRQEPQRSKREDLPNGETSRSQTDRAELPRSRPYQPSQHIESLPPRSRGVSEHHDTQFSATSAIYQDGQRGNTRSLRALTRTAKRPATNTREEVQAHEDMATQRRRTTEAETSPQNSSQNEPSETSLGQEKINHSCRVTWCDRPGKRYGLCWTHGGVKRCMTHGCLESAIIGEFCGVHGMR